jgi:hypothetical protein
MQESEEVVLRLLNALLIKVGINELRPVLAEAEAHIVLCHIFTTLRVGSRAGRHWQISLSRHLGGVAASIQHHPNSGGLRRS